MTDSRQAAAALAEAFKRDDLAAAAQAFASSPTPQSLANVFLLTAFETTSPALCELVISHLPKDTAPGELANLDQLLQAACNRPGDAHVKLYVQYAHDGSPPQDRGLDCAQHNPQAMQYLLSAVNPTVAGVKKAIERTILQGAGETMTVLLDNLATKMPLGGTPGPLDMSESLRNFLCRTFEMSPIGARAAVQAVVDHPALASVLAEDLPLYLESNLRQLSGTRVHPAVPIVAAKMLAIGRPDMVDAAIKRAIAETSFADMAALDHLHPSPDASIFCRETLMSATRTGNLAVIKWMLINGEPHFKPDDIAAALKAAELMTATDNAETVAVLRAALRQANLLQPGVVASATTSANNSRETNQGTKGL